MANYQKSYSNKPLARATTAAERLVKDYGLDPSLTTGMAAQLRRGMIHGLMGSRIVRYAERKENAKDVGQEGKPSLASTLLTLASKPVYHGPGAPTASTPTQQPEQEKKSKSKAGLVLTKIPPHAVKLTKSSAGSSAPKEQQQTLFDLSEGCGCDKKLAKKVKEKYLKEFNTVTQQPVDLFSVNSITDFSKINFTKFLGKKVLAETIDGVFYGLLGTSKTGFGVYKNGTLQRTLEEGKLLKFVCEDTKYVFKFPTNEFLEEKKVHRGGKILVTNKAGTKVLGTHESEASADSQLKAIHASQARRGKLHESSELLLKESIKNRWFVKEEIVNPDNEFTMTDDEIYERDKIADKILNDPKKLAKIKNKSKKKGTDTDEEKAHRVATYIVLSHRKGGGSKKGAGYQSGLFQDLEGSKSKRRAGRDLVKGDKTEQGRRKKETKTTKTGKKVTRNIVKSGKKGIIKPKYREEAEKLQKQRKKVPEYMRRRSANLTGAEGMTRAQFAKARRANEERRAPKGR